MKRVASPMRWLPLPLLLLLLLLLLLTLTLLSASPTPSSPSPSSVDVVSNEAAAGRRRQQQAGVWVPAGSCISGQACTSSGTCLKAATYNSTSGCGSNKTESVIEYASSNCRTTGCNYQNCGPDEIEVSSTWCVVAYKEKCCKKAYSYTCREVLKCTWVATTAKTLPPPPPVASPSPITAVFATGGAWDANAKFNKKTNAYIAAILANYIYPKSFGSSTSENEFVTHFQNRVAKPLGATRCWVYTSAGGGNEYAFLETPSSVIAVFRGTEITSASDLTADVLSLMTTATSDFGGSGVRIGSGWFRVYSSTKVYFANELRTFMPAPAKPLWFIGHSLGGAYAALYAAYTQINVYTVAGVYTFGSPIVGNAAWKSAYPLANRTYRYAVDGDPVIKLPVGTSWSTVNHVGSLQRAEPCPASAAAVGRRRMSEVAAPVEAVGPAESPAAAGATSANTSRPAASSEGEGAPPPLQQPQPECRVVRIEGLQGDGPATVVTEAAAPLCGPFGSPNRGTGAATTSKAAAAAGSGTTTTRAFSDHKMLNSYTANIFFCVLTKQEAATVPSFTTIQRFKP